MGKGNFIIARTWLTLQKVTITCTRRFHGSSTCTTSTFDAKILARGFHQVSGGSSSLTEEGKESSTNSKTCIYKVPSTMRQVNIKAYDPNIVSIGPYHHGLESLQEMEKLKHTYYRRLFQPNYHDQLDDDEVVSRKKKAEDDSKKAMEEMEEEARSCYSEQSKLSSKEFVKMMLIDGCFIIGLLRDSLQSNFEHTPSIIQRWMLPTLRRDLIKLENQLPLFVLHKLFQLTKAIRTTYHEEPIASVELEELALRFFNPLLRGHDVLTKPQQHYAAKSWQGSSSNHFLDLFHNIISPDFSTRPALQEPRGKQTKQILSIQELKEAGVKFTTDRTRGPLDISFTFRAWGFGRVLTIPRIHIDDHKGTLFRNMVAFEKCDLNSHQDVTAYLFFLDGLVNSAKDIGLLHYHEVMYHSLGSNERVAELVNNLCEEVDPVVSKSYLYKVVIDVNEYQRTKYGRIRGFLVHHHFNNWLVVISTLGACLALYLALIQTGHTVADNRHKMHEHITLVEFLKVSLLWHHVSRWGSIEHFVKKSLPSVWHQILGSFGNDGSLKEQAMESSSVQVEARSIATEELDGWSEAQYYFPCSFS